MSTQPVETDPEDAARSSIDALLRAIIAEVLSLDPARVAEFGPETGLFGYLPELDSMAVATLFTAMEDRFGFVIVDEEVDAEMLENYGALLAFAQSKCAED